ncbi:hypothetical protein Pr1d_42130 [Bythopirellula goksoeyrii]|uniref:Uncharacterized protein n=1 Tax=Bythopirellula goksoeyrii TaxID=1400387 RepID=A0A5B9QIN0_9BACT|nr:hypothetical protein [Bythopirellula goksoeyrii]QEG36876.1 hypothetical protein Pr1d_42130 [Bythopirellula goksoeyrii]
MDARVEGQVGAGKMLLAYYIVERVIASDSAKALKISIRGVDSGFVSLGDSSDLGVYDQIAAGGASGCQYVNHVRNMVLTFPKQADDLSIKPRLDQFG